MGFKFLQTHATSYVFLQTHATFRISTVKLHYTVNEKGGKPDRKPYPLPYGFRNLYRNLKSGNSQDYAQKPQQLYVHEFGFWTLGPLVLEVYILTGGLKS
jgi:hypothetical protein